LQLHTRIDEDWGREDLPVDRNWSQSASQPPQEEGGAINLTSKRKPSPGPVV
jgi:hypothetical protein